MKKQNDLWKEIDDAVVSGFISKMDEIKKVVDPHIDRKKCIYGTRIFFNSMVTLDQMEKVAHYIRGTYHLRVEQSFPLFITIWHRSENSVF